MSTKCSLCHKKKEDSEFHPARTRKRDRKYCCYCKECSLSYVREWRRKNADKARAINNRSRVKNPLTYRWNLIVKRAKKTGLGTMGLAEFKVWFNEQKPECVYCGLKNTSSLAVFKQNLSIDRTNNKKGYTKGNIVLACRKCNMVKSSHLTFNQMMTVAKMFFRNKRENETTATP